MLTKLDPRDLWGRVEQYDDYDRFRIRLSSGLDGGVGNKELGTPSASMRRIRYNNGLFYIFKTTAKEIQIKYKFHHSDSDDYFSSRQTLVEPQLCGKLLDGNWIMLNTRHALCDSYPNMAEKLHTITYKLLAKETFDKFQFCLPFGVKALDVEIITDKAIEVIKPTKVEFAFLGSSVTNMSAINACCSLTAQIYRELSINCCNLAIPVTSSLAYKEMFDYVAKHREFKWIVCDTVNIEQNNIDIAKKHKLQFACIKSRLSKCIFKDVNYIFEFDNPVYNYDHLHLTNAGAYAFVQKLIPVLKERMRNEKSSNN